MAEESDKLELTDIARLAKHAREGSKAKNPEIVAAAERAVNAIARAEAARVEAAILTRFLNDM